MQTTKKFGPLLLLLGIFVHFGPNAIVGRTPQDLAADRQGASAALQQSEDYFRQNNLPAAIERLSRSIQLDPTYARAYAWRGNAYLRSGDSVRALADYDAAVRLDPENPEHYKTRGDGFMELNRFAEAARDYKKMYEVEPWNVPGHSLAGAAYMALGDLDSALVELDEGVKREPSFGALYIRRGQLFQRVGLTREAEMEFRMGLRFMPQNSRQMVMDQIASSRREPRNGSLKASAPGPRADALNTGIRLQLWKKSRAAIPYFDEAIATDPVNAEAYRYRGRAYSDLWQIERAMEDFDRAIQLNPRDVEAHRLRGLALQSLNEWDRAIQEFTLAISLAADRAVLYLNRAQAYRRYMVNRPSLALADAYKAVEVEPENPYAWHFRGVVRMEQRDPYNHGPRDPGGIEDLNKAIALKPDFAEAYCNRGFDEYVQFSDPVSGRKDLDRCFELKPELRTHYLREINTATTKLTVFEEGMQLYLSTALGPGCGGERKEARGDYIVITRTHCTPEQIRAYAARVARMNRDKAILSDSGPCEGKHAGAYRACLAGDYAASDRFEMGAATAQDKVRFGKY